MRRVHGWLGIEYLGLQCTIEAAGVVVDSTKHESDKYIDLRVANHPEPETAAATTPRLPTLLASALNHDTHSFSLSLASSR